MPLNEDTDPLWELMNALTTARNYEDLTPEQRRLLAELHAKEN